METRTLYKRPTCFHPSLLRKQLAPQPAHLGQYFPHNSLVPWCMPTVCIRRLSLCTSSARPRCQQSMSLSHNFAVRICGTRFLSRRLWSQFLGAHLSVPGRCSDAPWPRPFHVSCCGLSGCARSSFRLPTLVFGVALSFWRRVSTTPVGNVPAPC